jgi:hypothetical protein
MIKSFCTLLLGSFLLLDIARSEPGTPDWPFTITPEASPALHLLVSKFTEKEYTIGISLRHKLIFDGADYQSILVTLGIESHLVSSGRGKFIWSRFDGSEVTLSLESAAPAAPGAPWILKSKTPEVYEVRSADNTEHYYFNKCLLIEFNIRERFYQLDYEHGQIIAATRHKPTAEQLFTIVYDDRRTINHISIQGHIFHYHYDDNFKLDSINSDAGLNVVFGYENQLLSKVELNDSRFEFTWGPPKSVDYFRSPLPCPPAITSDSFFTYETVTSRDYFSVSFSAKRSRDNGGWTLNKHNGAIQYKSN